jgi:putative pyruvate formate lyase activating enzyme
MVDMEPKIAAAYDILRACKLCPRNCGVDRFTGHVGFCGMGRAVVVSSAAPHFGEEGVLVGSGGSGTIFLAGCNLGCVFCQNYDISHLRQGTDVSIDEVVSMMLRLQQIGCHNINFVTPTHFTPQLMDAIHRARQQGLTVPIVWNCGGYEALETLRLLEGFVEVYMPDAKYAGAAVADELSAAPDYPDVMKAAVREMQRQVGDLQIVDGIATRGLLVRHLVLPNNAAGSRAIIDFLADEISPNCFVNVMAQYRPMFKARLHKAINRPPSGAEFEDAYNYAVQRGLRLSD